MCLIGLAQCETHLSGTIGGMTFDQAGNPYIINDNIIVQKNKASIIKAGCVFLFNNFSGMIVEGELAVEGTLDTPVVFTTVNDSNYSENPKQLANPFDWNGILITRSAARVKMSNFILAYSVYGIKSEKEEFNIENGTFKANGQFHVTVKGAIKPVDENYPYSYGFSSSQDTSVHAGSVKRGLQNKRVSEKGDDEKKRSMVNKRSIVPLLIGASGIVSGVVCAISVNDLSDTRAKYGAERNAGIRDDLKKKGNNQFVTSIVTGGIGLVAIPVAIVLYLRDNRRFGSEQGVSFMPLIGYESSGALVLIGF